MTNLSQLILAHLYKERLIIDLDFLFLENDPGLVSEELRMLGLNGLVEHVVTEKSSTKYNSANFPIPNRHAYKITKIGVKYYEEYVSANKLEDVLSQQKKELAYENPISKSFTRSMKGKPAKKSGAIHLWLGSIAALTVIVTFFLQYRHLIDYIIKWFH